MPKPCYYSILQYWSDVSREEGRNVGLIVVREPDEIVVRVLKTIEDLEPICLDLGVPEWLLKTTLFTTRLRQRIESLDKDRSGS